LEINRDGAWNVAAAARQVRAVMVYPSTDYVFDGRASRPYCEDDRTCPLGAYGRSKLAGEEAVRASGAAHLVVRSSWLYGSGGRNFVDTIRALANERDALRVVGDQRGRPTWTGSLARSLLDLIDARARGTFHASDAGDASWFELAKAILEITGLGPRLVSVTTSEWNARAPRPPYSVLALKRAEGVLGRPFPHWRRSLETYLRGDR
jgi:dTDP-4-dehydrorhamnose reductase